MGRCKQANHCANTTWCSFTGRCLRADTTGPLPAVPFCRVRDVMSTAMAMTLRQNPDGELYTAAQMRDYAAQEVAAGRERIEALRQALLKCKTCALPTEVRDLVNAALRA